MTHASQQRRMERLWRKWGDRLGLYGWDVVRTYHDGDFIQADGRPSTDAAGSTHVDWEYRQASIAWNTQALSKYDDAHAEVMIVHEIMHILLNEMRETDIKHEERVATTLAWNFVNMDRENV